MNNFKEKNMEIKILLKDFNEDLQKLMINKIKDLRKTGASDMVIIKKSKLPESLVKDIFRKLDEGKNAR